MARTNITLTACAVATAVKPTTVAVDQANGMEVAAGGYTARLLLWVKNSDGVDHNLIVRKWQNPPAVRSAIGDLTLSIKAGEERLIAIEGSRHVLNSGKINVDFAAGFAGDIAAYQLPDDA
jgi:hypothetical protein